ncbi:hypothetical protein G6F31_017821 [Rhizopus arrhizus]|nr:hypothetical protein G6F31_017821 [Rhizopus arrhizus]
MVACRLTSAGEYPFTVATLVASLSHEVGRYRVANEQVGERGLHRERGHQTPATGFQRCARDVARLAGGGEETGEDLAAAAALRLVDDSDLPSPTSSRLLIPAGDPAGEHSAELGNRQVQHATRLVERNNDRSQRNGDLYQRPIGVAGPVGIVGAVVRRQLGTGQHRVTACVMDRSARHS